MSINFFEIQCKSTTTTQHFGLCDAQNGSPAFIDEIEVGKWIAKIENLQAEELTFIAIDNCIPIYRENGDLESRCDAMITYINNIIFIELKEKERNWINDGVEQLKNSIILFKKHHSIEIYPKKRAVLANKKHPHFQHSHKEIMQQFKHDFDVRLIIHNTVKI